MSTYMPEDAGGYDIADVRANFIAPLAEAADAALAPARALLDASPARPIADNVRQAFATVGTLFDGILERRRQMQAEAAVTRFDVLRERWAAYGVEVAGWVTAIEQTHVTGKDMLEVALKDEALPTSADPARVLLARQEIELALRAASTDSPLMVMLGQAERGGDVAAAAASEWGRLTLTAAKADDDGFNEVLEAAIQTSLNGPDEGKRRAAAALVAMRTPRPGQHVASFAEAQAFAGFVLAVCLATVQHGIVLG